MKIALNGGFLSKPATGIGVVSHAFLEILSTLPEASQHIWIWYHEGKAPIGVYPSHIQFRSVPVWWLRDDLPHRYLYEHVHLPRMVERESPDVFFHLYQSATILPANRKQVMLVHDLIPERFPEYLPTFRQKLYYRAVKKAIHKTSICLVPSQATAHDLKQFLHYPSEQIYVVPLGVDDIFRKEYSPSEISAVLSKYNLVSGYFYHGGGIEKRKNTELLLRSYAALKRECVGRSIPPLVISGFIHDERNPLAYPLERRIRELGFEREEVRLLGEVPKKDLPALYQAARLFLYPSRYEGFGLPVLEAFASGTPVVTTKAGSLGELVQDSAITLDPDDETGLQEILFQSVQEKNTFSDLRKRGKERAKDYTWRQWGEQVVSLLIQ